MIIHIHYSLIYSSAHYIITDIITPALAELPIGAHNKLYKELIPTGYPFTPAGSRDTSVDKMHCLRAYAPGGIRTHDPRIPSREHDHYTTVLPL